MAAVSLGSQAVYIYMEDVASLLWIEGDIIAARTTIILSQKKNILLLIVNNGFPIDKLMNKHNIVQIKVVQYMIELGLKC